MFLLRITFGSVAILLFCYCSEVRSEKKYAEDDILELSIEALSKRTFDASLEFEKELYAYDTFKAELMSYHSDGLKVYTLVQTPTIKKPTEGYPVLIFGHGYHPNPQEYGIEKLTGEDARPGDYYRGVPGAYASAGYMVLTPDYRGHNKSEGYEYTQMHELSPNYYSVDLLHLLSCIEKIPHADKNRIYYMGHSMGGYVGMRMVMSTQEIRAASFWSASLSDTYTRSIYYNTRYRDSLGRYIRSDTLSSFLEDLHSTLPNKKYSEVMQELDPIFHVDKIKIPLMFQHAIEDRSVPIDWTERFVSKMYSLGKSFEFYTYPSDNHLFQTAEFDIAFERDTAFFQKYK